MAAATKCGSRVIHPPRVAFAPGVGGVAQPLPSGMFDLDVRACVVGEEPDRDVGGRVTVGPQVPEVGEPARRLQAVTSPHSCSVPSGVIS